MNTEHMIQTGTDTNGRTTYTVAGMVTTYDPQEAIDLTATGVFDLRCMLTRSAVEPRFGHRMEHRVERIAGAMILQAVVVPFEAGV
jgi:hypothetical protein